MCPAFPVPRLGPVVSPQEERPPGCHQDAKQVYQIGSEVAVCLLHAHQDCQQAAGWDGGRVRSISYQFPPHSQHLKGTWLELLVNFFSFSFFWIVTTAPCLTSLRAAWGTRMRWWCTRLPLPLCTCPTARPESWRLLFQVSTHLFFSPLICEVTIVYVYLSKLILFSTSQNVQDTKKKSKCSFSALMN